MSLLKTMVKAVYPNLFNQIGCFRYLLYRMIGDNNPKQKEASIILLDELLKLNVTKNTNELEKTLYNNVKKRISAELNVQNIPDFQPYSQSDPKGINLQKDQKIRGYEREWSMHDIYKLYNNMQTHINEGKISIGNDDTYYLVRDISTMYLTIKHCLEYFLDNDKRSMEEKLKLTYSDKYNNKFTYSNFPLYKQWFSTMLNLSLFMPVENLPYGYSFRLYLIEATLEIFEKMGCAKDNNFPDDFSHSLKNSNIDRGLVHVYNTDKSPYLEL